MNGLKTAFTIRAPNASGSLSVERDESALVWRTMDERLPVERRNDCAPQATTSKGRSADQPAQPVGLTAPGVPALVEFVADQLANLEQPVDLRLQQVRFSPFHGDCVPFH